jgi:hypothetical protein
VAVWVLMVSRDTLTGQSTLICHVVALEKGVSPGHIGVALEIVWLMSQSVR